VEYRPDRKRGYVAIQCAGVIKQWKFPDAYGAFASDVNVTAPVMFAGFAITASKLKYDDYAGVDVRGKLVTAVAPAI